jgi:hypothetical protein
VRGFPRLSVPRIPSQNLCPNCGASLPLNSALVCPMCVLQATESHAALFSPANVRYPYALGSYQLVRPLGEGGMGVVFEAEHEGSGRRVALKVLKEFEGDERERRRFFREGELASTIDHPNSVYVFGTEEIDGLLVIAMELAAAGTLREEVRRRGPLPVREAVDRVLDVLGALEVAHARGVLHRDIKPANCFLDAEGRTLIGDYGLSISPLRHRQGDSLTQSGAFLGTPAYCAPEQIRGLALDFRTDFYSLAGTLYFLLSGRSPVEAYAPMEAIAAALEGRIADVREWRAEVPPDLGEVVKRAMSPRVEARYADHAAFRQALVPFSSQVPLPAPLGARAVAGLVDLGWMLVGFGGVRAGLLAWRGAPEDPWISWGEWGIGGVMFAGLVISEIVWGASPGKGMLGLQLVGTGGGRPAPSKVLWRASVFVGALVGLWLLCGLVEKGASEIAERVIKNAVSGQEEWHREWKTGEGAIPAELRSFAWIKVCQWVFSLGVSLLSFLGLFYALFWRRLGPERVVPLHDQRTGIRVVLGSALRRELPIPDALEWEESEGGREGGACWGPIRVGRMLGRGWRLGLDPVLRRKVVLERREGDGKDGEARRACTRATRLRWLQAVSDPTGQVWEVWQAPSGSPLCEVMRGGELVWRVWLGWMGEVAGELCEAARDGIGPKSLGLAQVWVTGDRRALLLDRAWCDSAGLEGEKGSEEGGGREEDPLRACQGLLWRMAQGCPGWRRPLHTDVFLGSLKKASIERWSHLLGLLALLRKRTPFLSAKVREGVMLLPMIALPLISTLNGFLDSALNDRRWALAFPGTPPLSMVMDELGVFFHERSGEPEAKEDEMKEGGQAPGSEPRGSLQFGMRFKSATPLPYIPTPFFILRRYPWASEDGEWVRAHVRARYGSFFNEAGEKLKSVLEDKNVTLDNESLETLQEYLEWARDLPPLDPEVASEADRRVGDLLERVPRYGGVRFGMRTQDLLLGFNVALGMVLCGAALCQLVSVLVIGSPLLMRLTGGAFVGLTERPAGRVRLLGRWALVWGVTLGSQYGAYVWGYSAIGSGAPLAVMIGAPLLALGLPGALVFPRRRSLLDRLTGVWKVSR